MKSKNKRRRARARLMEEVARRLVLGLPVPAEAIEYVKQRIESQPPVIGKQTAPRSRTRDSKYDRFYRSAEWKRLRYDTLERCQGRCECCGASAKNGAVLNVDHIKPVRKEWDRRLDPTNTQVLCASCNWGKGNRFSTDWR